MSWYLKRCLQLPLPCLSVCLPQEGLFPNHCSNYFDQAAKCQSGLPLVGDHMGWAWANYFIFNKFQGLEASYHHNSNTTLPLTATLSGCAAARRQKQPGCPSPEAQWKYSTHTQWAVFGHKEKWDAQENWQIWNQYFYTHKDSYYTLSPTKKLVWWGKPV